MPAGLRRGNPPSLVNIFVHSMAAALVRSRGRIRAERGETCAGARLAPDKWMARSIGTRGEAGREWSEERRQRSTVCLSRAGHSASPRYASDAPCAAPCASRGYYEAAAGAIGHFGPASRAESRYLARLAEPSQALRFASTPAQSELSRACPDATPWQGMRRLHRHAGCACQTSRQR